MRQIPPEDFDLMIKDLNEPAISLIERVLREYTKAVLEAFFEELDARSSAERLKREMTENERYNWERFCLSLMEHGRKEYKLNEAQFNALIDDLRREGGKRAWQRLGSELGFDWKTVQLVEGDGPKFLAKPLENKEDLE